MICKYAKKYEESDEVGRHFLHCKIEDVKCPFVRYCKTYGDVINLDNVDKKCKIYLRGDIMKKGQLRVEKEKRGMLYVRENQNTVTLVRNPFDEIPEHVDGIVQVKGEYFVKGFEPKRTYTKKKEEVEE